MFAAFQIPLSWGELLKRTAKEANEDDVLGLAAQLSYYFFLALFPAVLFILAVASFFPLTNFIDEIVSALRPIAPADVLSFSEEQLRRLSNADSAGILTTGILGAIWSSSAAVVAIIGSLNRAYDIEEGRPWWKVRLTAIGLTLGLALLVLTSFTLIVAGPTIATQVASSFGLGSMVEWTWRILQWPLAFALVSTAQWPSIPGRCRRRRGMLGDLAITGRRNPARTHRSRGDGRSVGKPGIGPRQRARGRIGAQKAVHHFGTQSTAPNSSTRPRERRPALGSH